MTAATKLYQGQNLTTKRAEAEARRLLRPRLRRSLSLARLAERTLRQISAHLESRDSSAQHEQVLAILLARAADDLHIVVRCASEGYPLQAMTVAASLFELAYTIGYVGPSDERAAEWLHWPRYDQTPWPLKRMVEDTLKAALGARHRRGPSQETNFYAALCWAKHANPNLQGKILGPSSADAHVLHTDPLITPSTARRSEVAIWMAARPLAMSLLALRMYGLIPANLLPSFDELMSRYFALDEHVRRTFGHGGPTGQ
jgi:hypothetical protein